jgi:PAS domain S-box-containing protein
MRRAAVVASDITEAKRAQLLAEEQAARLTLALDSARMGVWDYDVASDVVSWDERTGDLFDLGGRGEMVWDDFLAILHAEDAPQVLAAGEAAMAGANGGFYRIEHRIIAHGGVRWVESCARTVFDRAGQAVRILGAVRDISAEVRSRERSALLMAEVNHRVKNSLATVQAIARQTVRGAAHADDFRSVFESRLAALAQAHDVLGAGDWAAAHLGDLVRGALEPFGAGVCIAGGPALVAIPPERALTVAVILHELATNAAKYGALSVPAGRAVVSWRLVEDGVELNWREECGPSVAAPSRAGFGTRLLRSALAGREGWTAVEFDPAGVRARVVVRTAALASEAAA